MNVIVRSVLLSAVLIVSWNSTTFQSSKSSPPELKPGWKRVDAAGSFSFSVPETMRKVKVQGVDSYVGQYASNGLHVLFDYGMYSDPLERYSNEAEYIEINRKIAGLDARIVFFRQPNHASKHRYFAAVHIPKVAGDRGEGITKLTMVAQFNEQSDWGTAQNIFESIRFK